MKRIPREVIKEFIQSEEFKSTGDIMEVMEAELDTALGYDKQERRGESTEESKPRNYRHGHTSKTVKTQLGEVNVSVPRDRN